MSVIDLITLVICGLAWIISLSTIVFIAIFILPSSIRKKIENYHDLD
jgi:hypothetical protein